MNTAEHSAIKGKHIAITGILTFYKREDAFDQIRRRGCSIKIIREDLFLPMLWFSSLETGC